ncbi:serine hydrolase [Nonlabens sp. Ci31]|uniref:serine hydrolase domain-containing protein n=1 Tax=Nonlabens sp. Ci31 TaxID=2608253 RepID=UPI001463F0D1|nr:serine hydrolase domain-containing protein [Nonlabens sp. Ci31]QJP34677.1 serine hydrolase [Nonlabens sp. Ci31]
MKKYYFTLLLSFSITFGFSQEAKKDYTDAFKLVEVWLEAQKDFDNIPGLTAIVVEDQKVLWSGAFGLANIEKNIKAEASTLCSICSISKLFTSVAIMKLYDEGKLRLDDNVSDLLPAYNLQQKYPESGPITIRSLLTHSSGLPREADYPYWTGPDFSFPSKAQINSKLSEQETLYPASTYLQYSNLGLTLLGEIVEKISGVPYEVYVQKNILDPLGLTDTRTVMPEQLYGKQLAIGYSAISRTGKREKVNFFQANGMTPAAGFSSNVQDLGKFASWQFRLRNLTITEILKPSTLKYMQNVHWTDPNWKTTWGLGFIVEKDADGNTWVGHDGTCPGYNTILNIDFKNKLAFSVMINANGIRPEKYVNGINGIIKKIETPKKPQPTSDKIEKVNLQEFVGYYSPMPWRSEEYISTWGDKLVMLPLPADNPSKAMILFKHIEGDTFRRIRDNEELGETLVFERDQNGKIIQFERHGNYSRRLER